MPLAIGEPYREHSKAKTKQNAVQTAFFSRLFRRCSFNTVWRNTGSEARNLARKGKSLPEVIRPSLIYPLEFKFSHELNASYEDTLFLFLTLSLGFFMLM